MVTNHNFICKNLFKENKLSNEKSIDIERSSSISI